MKSKTSRPSATKRSARPLRRARSNDNLRCVYSDKQIQTRVQELAKQINRDYEGKTLHVVGILEDAFVFMADLVRCLTMPVVCHFMKAEIRDTSAGPTALREIMYTPKVEATGRDVLLISGILQSGVTLDYLYRYILGQNPTPSAPLHSLKRSTNAGWMSPPTTSALRAKKSFWSVTASVIMETTGICLSWLVSPEPAEASNSVA